ncbi:unnamed protein product [Meganyctiphanes norvegica]|uniref:Uncharacterized protein n=1 Tax=Meganyctiphanes norvegica TaxID=48144 RepID=A0AAV2S337_MEGNR
MFRVIKSWFGYGEHVSEADISPDVEHGSQANTVYVCDVLFCHSKHINKWVLYFRWEHQHVIYELEKDNGLVEVTYSHREPPINYERSELASKIYLSPNTVYNTAMKSSLNGQKFERGWDICQKYVEGVCNKLDIELEYDEDNNPDFLSYFFKADVYFCHCPVPYINTLDISKRHWALYFSWEHKTVRYELGKNSGYIKSQCTQGDLPEQFTTELVCSGKWLRPEEVHVAAMNCSLNDQLYSAGWRNCQIWVEEVAEKLDIIINYPKISGVTAFLGHMLPVRLKNAKPAVVG